MCYCWRAGWRRWLEQAWVGGDHGWRMDERPPFITWRFAGSLLVVVGIAAVLVEVTELSGVMVLYCLLPGALVVGGLAVLGHTLGMEWWRGRVATGREERGLCVRCGYDVRDCTELCAECGMPIFRRRHPVTGEELD